MPPKCISARSFTVGWICALPIELAAAEEMMDEEFAGLPSQPNDTNIYSYGRIKDHNIVIACLPAGQMGTNSAAMVASQMKNKFPSIRFGVLVGIGGGVPNLDEDVDIRLGDVVISQPTGQHGGVIQYDFGKTGRDGRIARTGTLNAPPAILLNALTKLQAKDIRGETQAHVYLSKLSNKPTFASPGPGKDVLYEAASLHYAGATCKKCRREDVVDRDQRPTTAPVLFFGNIASGNQVMKDGLTRDKHSQEYGGVLCFEMEAAGLMNNFDCVVVRGICDYADAHKNKQWQPYAAATAAAFAKELLCYIPPLASNTGRHAIENALYEPHFVVPFGRNENFVGRSTILTQLLERIVPSANQDACQRTAIVGLGGIGKTQVAIEAAYRFRDAYPDSSVFWVPAISSAMFDNHYRRIGTALKLQGIEDAQKDVKTLVKNALERNDINNWLLIIDNADDIDLLFNESGLASYIPHNHRGSILLTTRNKNVAAKYSRTFTILLSEMDSEEGTELLHSGLNAVQIDEGESTLQLLEQLAYLPLAIQQASAYLRANPYTSVCQYLRYCESSDEERIELLSQDFDEQDRYEDVQNPVATTWLISFENIARDKPLAAKYLGFICYLAEKDIPMALLPSGDNERQRHEAIGTLMAYAFIIRRGSTESFDVHRLVRLVMRNWLKEQGKEEQQATETISWLSAAFPRPSKINKDLWVAYMPHVQAALKVSQLKTGGRPLWDLMRHAGNGSRLLRKTEEAEQMHRQALELKEKVLGPGDPEILASLHDLAVTLDHGAFFQNDQEKNKEAEEILRRVLRSRENALGAAHPNTLMTLHDLAFVLQCQGKNAAAETMLRQTLQLKKQVLGPKDPNTLMTLASLADTISDQDRYEEAEQVYQQALRLTEEVLGSEDPVTLTILSNVAHTLQRQGKMRQAVQTRRKVLDLEKKLLGTEDPDTLMTMSNLALTLKKQGRYKEAEQMNRQALELKTKVLGPANPETLVSLRELVNTLQIQGKYEEAERMDGQALNMGGTQRIS